jgi:hypothetical protein
MSVRMSVCTRLCTRCAGGPGVGREWAVGCGPLRVSLAANMHRLGPFGHIRARMLRVGPGTYKRSRHAVPSFTGMMVARGSFYQARRLGNKQTCIAWAYASRKSDLRDRLRVALFNLLAVIVVHTPGPAEDLPKLGHGARCVPPVQGHYVYCLKFEGKSAHLFHVQAAAGSPATK